MTENNSTTKKAVTAKVNLGFAVIDGLMLPNGDFAVAVPQVADVFGILSNNASRDIKSLLGEGFDFVKIKTDLNSKEINAMTLDQLFQFALAWYNKKPEKSRLDFCLGLAEYLGIDTEALKQLHTHNKHKGPRANTRQEERNIQLAYQARLGGKTEYPTPIGRIDLLTDDSLYEFKYYKEFKSAIGQVLTYKRYVSVKYLYIVLFGCPKNFKYSTLYTEMLSTCEDYEIRLRVIS